MHATTSMTAREQLGRIGEQMAARHLEGRGLAIVARNWRPRCRELRGELDLVAVDGLLLVVCEVKTRRGVRAGHPLEALTPAKISRLRRLAGAFVAEAADLETRHTRIDAVSVCWPDAGGRADIEHVEGIG